MTAPRALSPCLRLGSRCSRYLRHIEEGGFDLSHEGLRFARPRHASYPLILRTLFYDCCKRDHRHIRPLRGALAHGPYESLAHALIQSRSKEQQVHALKHFVDNPRGVGIEWPGLITGALKKRTEGAPDHRVCAEDGYGCGLWVLPHFGGSLCEIDLLGVAVPLDTERAGAVTPRPPRGCGVLYLL